MPIICPVCQTPVDPVRSIGGHVSPLNKQRYSLYSCGSCRLEFWHPLKIDPSIYGTETCFMYVMFHQGDANLLPPSRYFLKHFPHPKPAGRRPRLLDIGCGNGALLAAAEKLGYEVWGLDLDEKSIAAAKNVFGLKDVFALTLDEFAAKIGGQAGRFDVVMFVEVLEHQDDPLGFVRQAKNLLAPGGVIVGSVPNRERLWAEAERKNGVDWPPHHLLRLSKGSLRRLFARLGPADVRFRPMGYGLLEFANWLEILLFGPLITRTKAWINRTRFQGRDSAGNRRKLNALWLMKKCLNAAFVPLALLLFPFWLVASRRGHQIYFEVRYD